MIATSGFLTALEYTKYVFGRGSVPDPAGGAYSAFSPPGSLKGAQLLRGGEGKRRKRVGEVSEREGRGGDGREGRGKGK